MNFNSLTILLSERKLIDIDGRSFFMGCKEAPKKENVKIETAGNPIFEGCSADSEGAVINIPNTDDWIMGYHRRPIPNEDRDHRVTCMVKMEFNSDGTIKRVQITFEGVPAAPIN